MNLSCLLVLNMSRQTQEMCERQQYFISSGRWAGGVNRAFLSPYCRTVVIHHFYSPINYTALCKHRGSSCFPELAWLSGQGAWLKCALPQKGFHYEYHAYRTMGQYCPIVPSGVGVKKLGRQRAFFITPLYHSWISHLSVACFSIARMENRLLGALMQSGCPPAISTVLPPLPYALH